MTEPTKETIKALTDYGYVQDDSVFTNAGKGKRWSFLNGDFTLEVLVAGAWYPVANRYDPEYADSKRAPDHTWYEFPKRWIWEFTEDEVRESYVAGLKAAEANAG